MDSLDQDRKIKEHGTSHAFDLLITRQEESDLVSDISITPSWRLITGEPSSLCHVFFLKHCFVRGRPNTS